MFLIKGHSHVGTIGNMFHVILWAAISVFLTVRNWDSSGLCPQETPWRFHQISLFTGGGVSASVPGFSFCRGATECPLHRGEEGTRAFIYHNSELFSKLFRVVTLNLTSKWLFNTIWFVCLFLPLLYWQMWKIIPYPRPLCGYFTWLDLL